MVRRPPIMSLKYTLFPNTTLFRSALPFASKDRKICLKPAFPRYDRSSPTGCLSIRSGLQSGWNSVTSLQGNIMQIAERCVATFHYTLTDDTGTVIDSTSGREPLAYLHGAGNTVPRSEERREGKG